MTRAAFLALRARIDYLVRRGHVPIMRPVYSGRRPHGTVEKAIAAGQAADARPASCDCRLEPPCARRYDARVRSLTPLLLGLVAASLLLCPVVVLGCTLTGPDCDCGIGEPIPACQEECSEEATTTSATVSAAAADIDAMDEE